ncbi:hypothetical protein E2C01_039387 [Portunus trituberculatus]|uniref:Uncharacterized protein n=1 Tax=Portunus trituberculatus TaxID=210409 RepID=A0A5B7FEM0_PORTR|nr:hypothetical protein [Portunus trituberculatus]
MGLNPVHGPNVAGSQVANHVTDQNWTCWPIRKRIGGEGVLDTLANPEPDHRRPGWAVICQWRASLARPALP